MVQDLTRRLKRDSSQYTIEHIEKTKGKARGDENKGYGVLIEK